jgi:hypothetical protein
VPGKAKDPKKRSDAPDDGPVDLAARIGSRASEPVLPAASPPLERPAPPPEEPVVGRPTSIGGDEPVRPAPAVPAGGDDDPRTAPIVSVRGAPSRGEIDLVVTPLPTPDDWHRFELALRKVRGVSQLRPEYYRHGVAKMRVVWEGSERLASALRAGIPGYRVRVLGEDRATLQILVSSEAEERRPG